MDDTSTQFAPAPASPKRVRTRWAATAALLQHPLRHPAIDGRALRHASRRARLALTVVGAVSLALLTSRASSARPAVPASPERLTRPSVTTRSDIYTIVLATGRVARITKATDGAFYDGPSWSPDGRRLAFSGSPCDDCPDQDARLYLARLSTGRISPISLTVSPATRPSWGHGGRVIAFVGGLEGAIYSVRADGNGLVRLVGGHQHDAVAWSPVGQRIAYTAQEPDGGWDIYLADAAGRRAHALVHTAAAEEQPAWSPDGRRIAFTRQDADGGWSLYVVDVDGSHLHRVGPHWSMSSENPSFSPDGSRLAFAAVTSTDAALYVMNADGTHVQRIATQTPRSYDPVWSPDGRTLAFVGGH